jgi:hypothetical protein
LVQHTQLTIDHLKAQDNLKAVQGSLDVQEGSMMPFIQMGPQRQLPKCMHAMVNGSVCWLLLEHMKNTSDVQIRRAVLQIRAI